MSSRLALYTLLPLHLRYRRLRKPKDAIQVDPQRRSPLRLAHRRNRSIHRRPDTVIHDQHIQPSERLHRSHDQSSSVLRRGKLLLNRNTLAVSTQLRHQCLSLISSGAIRKRHTCPSLPKQPHPRRADPT